MKEKIKKIVKITDQGINQELLCEICKENLFLKPVYLIKHEINSGDNFGRVICGKCTKSKLSLKKLDG